MATKLEPLGPMAGHPEYPWLPGSPVEPNAKIDPENLLGPVEQKGKLLTMRSHRASWVYSH